MTDKRRILIVDDIPSNIRPLNEILRADYNISIATCGQDALDITFGAGTPDLILLDIMMPEMDGYEVCRRLKANEKSKDIPVIFITAISDVDSEAEGLALGAVDYITKPISPPIVKARVKTHLRMKTLLDQMKESISVMEHQAEILQQQAELGLQAAGLAHDINNILTGLMVAGLIPKMLPDDFSGKVQIEKYIKMVTESVDLGKEVCQGYTNYLRDIAPDYHVQPLTPLLQPVDMYAHTFKGELIKEFSDNLKPIRCRGYQIKRIMVNLFTNAYQATLGRKNAVITIKAWNSDGKVHFSITDNGQGIPEDVLPRIFEERFTTKKEGTGLGLFMVKEITESHQGTITVDSEEGTGTTIALSFPAVERGE